MRILLRIIALLVIIMGALSAIRRLMAAVAPPDRQVPRSGQGGRLVKDPICGTYVPQATALSAGDAFFCSEECRRKFLA
jgi:hypothetical protein